jgi:cupin domain
MGSPPRYGQARTFSEDRHSHHGEQDTAVSVLEGEACVRGGDFGEHSATVRAGDFLHVPSCLPHQEINATKEHSFRWVVVRSTPEPIVINLPDDFWTSIDPKPIETRRPMNSRRRLLSATVEKSAILNTYSKFSTLKGAV